jgi:hypothetical protein
MPDFNRVIENSFHNFHLIVISSIRRFAVRAGFSDRQFGHFGYISKAYG